MRVNCLDASRAWGAAEEVCLISRAWFSQRWESESFNNADRLCCSTYAAALAARSNYTLGALERVQLGRTHAQV